MSRIGKAIRAVALGHVCLFIFSVYAFADDVRLHYDRSGNVVGIQEAAATALSIDDVPPGFGAPGDAVTVLGGGFATTPSANAVTFNGTSSTVANATSSAISTTVPSGATTGLVSVTVAGSTAHSAQNFIVLPSGLTSSTISNATSITLDGSAVDVATVGSKSVAVAFSLTQATYVSFQCLSLAGTNTTSVAYSIYKPDNTLLQSGTVSVTAPTILLPLTPTTGVYTLYLKPQGWLKAHLSLTSDPNWSINGSASSVNVTLPYQKQRLWFSGTAAQNLTYAYTNLVRTPTSGGYPTFAFFKPDGTALTALTNLPLTGSYSFVVTQGSSTTSTSLQLWLSADLTGTLPMNASTALSVARPGQRARYTFSATQGQYIRLGITGVSTTPGNDRVSVYMYKPDGTTFVDGTSQIGTASAPYTYSLPVIPTTGTYTAVIEIDPYDNVNDMWSTTLTLTTDPTATITVDGAATPIATTMIGQQVRATFAGTAGQNLGFAYTNFSITPSTAGALQFSWFKPDGTTLSALTNLPLTGTYTLVITPPAATTASSVNLWLSSEVTGTLPMNASTALSVARPGQRARYTFSATQGQYIRLGITGVSTTPGNDRVSVYMYKPDGTTFVDGTSQIGTASAPYTYSLPVIPTTGTYTAVIEIDPYDNVNDMWSTTLTLTTDPTATITVDGAATPIATTMIGQQVRATFAGTAGQNLGFAYTNFSITPSTAGALQFSWFKPDGTTLSALTNLPLTGTYTLVITPPAATTASSVNLWLSNQLTGTLTLGTPAALSVSRPGQTGRYTFQGTTGQVIKFSASSTSTSPTGQRVAIYAYKPDGTALISGGYFNATSSGTATYTTAALTTTGTYTVTIGINGYDNVNSTWATTLTVSAQ